MRAFRNAAVHALILLSLLAGELAVTTALADVAAPTLDSSPVGQIQPSLKDTLEKGLKARYPADFEFVDLVADLVDQGKLPLDVVLSTFKWARPKKPAPMPYFKRAMQIRAAELGVDL